MSRKRRRRDAGSDYGALVLTMLGFAIFYGLYYVAESYPILTCFVAITIILFVGYLIYRYRRRRRFRHKTLGELLMLSPTQFEIAIANLFHDLGYRDVKHTGQPGDLTADIRCRDPKGRSVIIQCKRYAPGSRVGSRDLQTFIGMLTVHHQADSGIFVTTSSFTAPACQLARQHGIELVDGSRLTQLIEIARKAQKVLPDNKRDD